MARWINTPRGAIRIEDEDDKPPLKECPVCYAKRQPGWDRVCRKCKKEYDEQEAWLDSDEYKKKVEEIMTKNIVKTYKKFKICWMVKVMVKSK